TPRIRPRAGAERSARSPTSAASAPALGPASPIRKGGGLVDATGGMAGRDERRLPLLSHLPALLDVPQVAAGAREVMVSAGLADRCEVRGGDFFAEVPAGGDAYILSWSIHDWDHCRATTILERCRQAMTSRGRVLLVEAVIPSGNEAHAGKIMDFVML